MKGNKVSHANNKHRRRFLSNIQRKRFYIASQDAWVHLRVSCAALRTINKLGIEATLKKYGKEAYVKGLLA